MHQPKVLEILHIILLIQCWRVEAELKVHNQGSHIIKSCTIQIKLPWAVVDGVS